MHSAVALLALLGLSIPSAAQTMYATGDVIIVGAGVAGLNAARSITKAGKSVILLEARSRVGGRVWTDRTKFGFPVDLGASWIHGNTASHPITKEAAAGGISTVITNWDDDTMYYSNGNEVSDSAATNAENLFGQAEDYAATMERTRRNAGQGDIPLSTAISSFIASKKLSGEALTLFKWNVDSNIANEYGADPVSMSLFEWDSDGEFNGDERLFPNGYDQITSKIYREALVTGRLRLYLSHIVKSVSYSGGKVVVSCANGRYFQGKRIIVTVPLGVLKNPTASTGIAFSPALPADKTTAIGALGMGTLNKIYVSFPTAFWDNTDIISIVSSTYGQFTEGINLKKEFGKNALLFFQGGSYAVASEAKTDDQLANELMAILRNIYGDNIPNPTAKLVTRWTRDPYTFGSYSYQKTGSNPGHRTNLAKSVNNMLWFAGEAAHNTYPSTVHGAFLSGQTAATQVLGSGF